MFKFAFPSTYNLSQLLTKLFKQLPILTAFLLLLKPLFSGTYPSSVPETALTEASKSLLGTSSIHLPSFCIPHCLANSCHHWLFSPFWLLLYHFSCFFSYSWDLHLSFILCFLFPCPIFYYEIFHIYKRIYVCPQYYLINRANTFKPLWLHLPICPTNSWMIFAILPFKEFYDTYLNI